MKDLQEQLQKLPSTLIIALGVILTLGISFVLVYFLIFPTFSEMTRSSDEIKAKNAKLEGIKQSISFLAAADKNEIETIGQLFDNLVPNQLDMLHFVSLNEKIAQAAGATVQTITISKAPVVPTTTPASGTSTATPPPTTPVVGTPPTPTTVNVTYLSNFDSMVNLIKLWREADQLVGVITVNINSTNSGVLGYTVTYDLPISQIVTKATVDDLINLNVVEKKAIEEIESKIIYVATPSSKPVGKSNPFQ